MHQYKTIAQTLLALSVISLVTAAPAVPLEVRDTDNDVVVVAEDVAIVSDRRRGTPPVGTTVTTPSQYSSSSSLDGSPPHDPLPLDDPKSALFHGSESSTEWAPSNHLAATDGQNRMPVYDSTWEASTSAHPLPAHPLSTAVGPAAPVHDSTWEASTSAPPLSTPDRPVPVPDSNTEASTSSQRPVPVPVRGSPAGAVTTPHYTAITPNMLYKDPQKISTTNKVLGFGFLASVVVGIVLLSALQKGHQHNNGTTGG